jgi:hypothetical protein
MRCAARIVAFHKDAPAILAAGRTATAVGRRARLPPAESPPKQRPKSRAMPGAPEPLCGSGQHDQAVMSFPCVEPLQVSHQTRPSLAATSVPIAGTAAVAGLSPSARTAAGRHPVGFTKSNTTATELSCVGTVPQCGSTAATPMTGPCDWRRSRLPPS